MKTYVNHAGVGAFAILEEIPITVKESTNRGIHLVRKFCVLNKQMIPKFHRTGNANLCLFLGMPVKQFALRN